MKTLRTGLLALTLLLLPSAALAQATLIGTIGADSRTTPVSAAAPLPVTGTVTTTAQAGAGATTATTTRTVTATDSPDVTALGTIAASTGALDDAVSAPGVAAPAAGIQVTGSDGANARALRTDATGALQVEDAAVEATVGATSAAVPASAQLMGAADSVSGTMMPLRIYDADTGAGNDYRLGVVPILPGAGGGTPASAGGGAVDAGTIRVVPGSISSSTPLALVAVDASEVEVLPAMVGRRGWGVQIYNDQDGPICCSLGATTTACANAGFMLDPSPAASRAGGHKEDSGYSGAVTCRAMGAYTVSVARFQY